MLKVPDKSFLISQFYTFLTPLLILFEGVFTKQGSTCLFIVTYQP